MIELRLLGPLEALEDGHPLAIPRGKPSAVLACLALDAHRVVAIETLIDRLWAEPQPASAHKLVQIYVSQLRKQLGSAIETRAPGYRLSHDTATDLGRFERFTEAAHATGDPARTAELAEEALSLWRGPALAEFRHEPFAAASARRLAELRLGILERRIEAELELGKHAQLVPELEALVAQEPLRERARSQLMLALYRSGRQAEALECFRRGRKLLIDELGIEPSRPLQDLHQAVLRRDSALDLSSSSRAELLGCVICGGSQLEALVAPLCKDGRELLLVEIADEPAELPRLSAALEKSRGRIAETGIKIRTVCFTSSTPWRDLCRLAREQSASLFVAAGLPPQEESRDLLAELPCDLALAPRPELRLDSADAVLVPFGGRQEEWAALELGAWLARAHELPLRILGTEADSGHRDASRMLANASLALQRFAGITAEPVIVAAGIGGILAQRGAIIVASYASAELDTTRQALIEGTEIPLLFVRRGLRPGGLASAQTLTKFSWSLAEE